MLATKKNFGTNIHWKWLVFRKIEDLSLQIYILESLLYKVYLILNIESVKSIDELLQNVRFVYSFSLKLKKTYK